MKHSGKLTIPNFSSRSTFKVFSNELYVFTDPLSFTVVKYSEEERKWINF